MIDASANVTAPEGRGRLSPIGIALHHSVTTMDADATEAQELAHIEAIDRHHVSIGYGGFGYHSAVFPSGRAYICGQLTGMRAHVARRNHELIGIVAIGNFVGGLPLQPQMEGIVEAIKDTRSWFPDRSLPVKGHNDWALPGEGTACAGLLNGVDFDALLQIAAPEPVIAASELDQLKTVIDLGHFITQGWVLRDLAAWQKRIVQDWARRVS